MPKQEKPSLGRNRKVGYARVSTFEQVLDLQLDALFKVGVHEDNLWKEFVSGVDARRPQLDLALADARKGDVFYVWKLDRFGRNAREVMQRVEELEKRGVGFRSITEQFDTTSAMGKVIFGMHALFAQLERDVIRERTLAGMAAARARGRIPGQPAKVTDKNRPRIEQMFRDGLTVAEVAKKVRCTDNTIYTHFDSETRARLKSEGER